jgi:hypothetical protein
MSHVALSTVLVLRLKLLPGSYTYVAVAVMAEVAVVATCEALAGAVGDKMDGEGSGWHRKWGALVDASIAFAVGNVVATVAIV